MENVFIHNVSQAGIAPVLVKYCDSFLCRLRGLMFSPPLPVDRGLLLVYAADSRVDTAIHMLAVRSDLAVIWISAAMRVVDTRFAKKGKLYYAPSEPARFVLELNPLRIHDFERGDEVAFEAFRPAE
jgi:uncharacterized membrane protein (UPF0127 family)